MKIKSAKIDTLIIKDIKTVGLKK